MARNTKKANDVAFLVVQALAEQCGVDAVADRLLDVWTDAAGRVALLVDSAATAAVVMHALWLRYEPHEERHPSGGVLLWVS